MRQQEEVEKKAEVAMEMSDLVVYCQPRSKEKDRFGKDIQIHIPHIVVEVYFKEVRLTISLINDKVFNVLR